MWFGLTSELLFFVSDDEENFVDEGAEDFKPSEPQSKAEARGAIGQLALHGTVFNRVT